MLTIEDKTKTGTDILGVRARYKICIQTHREKKERRERHQDNDNTGLSTTKTGQQRQDKTRQDKGKYD
jgi:hypothetical protein